MGGGWVGRVAGYATLMNIVVERIEYLETPVIGSRSHAPESRYVYD